MTERPLDVICMGRAAVDLYGQQVGGRLEDMQSFRKYLGGSSGNLAAGLARLGARSAMLTRVGDDHMGRFVREALAREGVDVRAVRTDPSRLTGLVLLGIEQSGAYPHIFYRERCADMGVTVDDFDEAFIASSRALAISGTHLSQDGPREATRRAIEYARKNGTAVIFDIDYRPVLWGLGAPGDGQSRYVQSDHVTSIIGEFLAACDMIVGTEEELAIAGGSRDPLTALQHLRSCSDAAIVLKKGPEGCVVFDSDDIPSLETGVEITGLPVEVFNTLGAGDAFLSGFLCGWLEGKTWQQCGLMGNACGALVVSRHGCTPAMPSRSELDNYLGRESPPCKPDEDDELFHLHRSTTWRDDPRPLCLLAFDHRSQFEDLAGDHGRLAEDIRRFKGIIAEAVVEACNRSDGRVRHGALVDYRYGAEAEARLAPFDVWLASPMEVPGSRPLDFDPHFAAGQAIAAWPADRVVKCLVFYHPDDPLELRHAQEERVRDLYANLLALDRKLVLEVICPDIGASARPDPVARALRRFYNLGVRPDWWKLEAQSEDGWRQVTAVVRECDPHCKGIVILGLGADTSTLCAGLSVAAKFDLCRGFAVGRSIFAKAASAWFAGEIGDDEARRSVFRRYQHMIDTWTRARTAAAA